MKNTIRAIKDLPAKWRKLVDGVPGAFSLPAAESVVRWLRYEARLAFLDGRSSQSAKFKRYASIIEGIARKKD